MLLVAMRAEEGSTRTVGITRLRLLTSVGTTAGPFGGARQIQFALRLSF